jgi:hypothetical protein
MECYHWKRIKIYRNAGTNRKTSTVPFVSQIHFFGIHAKDVSTGVEKASDPSVAITSSTRGTAGHAQQEQVVRYAKSEDPRNCKNCGIFKNRNNTKSQAPKPISGFGALLKEECITDGTDLQLCD